MPKYKSPFSYYGGKSKIAHLYPAPTHDVIVEPFAGAACYSFRHHERQVILNDLDPVTAAIWRFLTSPDAADVVERLVPATVERGQRISDILPVDADPGLFSLLASEAVQGTHRTIAHYDGLIALLRSEANRGTQGANGVHDVITSIGAICWNSRLKRKLLEAVIPRVKHWTIIEGSYTDLPDTDATWFIDPPYSNPAGTRYRHSSISYTDLAAWTMARSGQVIVCENAGATWLPFTPLGSSARGMKSRYQKADAPEVIYTATQTRKAVAA